MSNPEYLSFVVKFVSPESIEIIVDLFQPADSLRFPVKVLMPAYGFPETSTAPLSFLDRTTTFSFPLWSQVGGPTPKGRDKVPVQPPPLQKK